MEDKITTIRISEHTKKKLYELGNRGETYEDIIIKLILNRDERRLEK